MKDDLNATCFHIVQIHYSFESAYIGVSNYYRGIGSPMMHGRSMSTSSHHRSLNSRQIHIHNNNYPTSHTMQVGYQCEELFALCKTGNNSQIIYNFTALYPGNLGQISNSPLSLSIQTFLCASKVDLLSLEIRIFQKLCLPLFAFY